MKRLFLLSLATTLAAGQGYAAQEEVDYPTRTLDARHALTTGSPHYADRDMEEERQEEVDAFNEYDANRRLEESQLAPVESPDRIEREESVEDEVIIQE